jgi:hypothetical protein
MSPGFQTVYLCRGNIFCQLHEKNKALPDYQKYLGMTRNLGILPDEQTVKEKNMLKRLYKYYKGINELLVYNAPDIHECYYLGIPWLLLSAYVGMTYRYRDKGQSA